MKSPPPLRESRTLHRPRTAPLCSAGTGRDQPLSRRAQSGSKPLHLDPLRRCHPRQACPHSCTFCVNQTTSSRWTSIVNCKTTGMGVRELAAVDHDWREGRPEAPRLAREASRWRPINVSSSTGRDVPPGPRSRQQAWAISTASGLPLPRNDRRQRTEIRRWETRGQSKSHPNRSW